MTCLVPCGIPALATRRYDDVQPCSGTNLRCICPRCVTFRSAFAHNCVARATIELTVYSQLGSRDIYKV